MLTGHVENSIVGDDNRWASQQLLEEEFYRWLCHRLIGDLR
jgi:hypothetical protein